jgi:hypothetical protein
MESFKGVQSYNLGLSQRWRRKGYKGFEEPHSIGKEISLNNLIVLMMASHIMLWNQGSTNHSTRCCVESKAPSKKNKPQNQLAHLQSEWRKKKTNG